MVVRLAWKILVLATLVATVEGVILIGPGGRDGLGDTYLAAWSAKHRRLIAGRAELHASRSRCVHRRCYNFTVGSGDGSNDAQMAELVDALP